MAKRLTKAEKRLIDYPPTPGTWLCTRVLAKAEKETRCNTINAASKKRCWWCREPRRSQAPLLWPKYLAACKKAGVKPKLMVATVEPDGEVNPPVALALPAWATEALKERT